jgi:hypothetical protein
MSTSLHEACQKEQLSIVKHLLSLQTSIINQPNDEGLTPLMIACKQGNIEIVKELLNQKDVIVNKEYVEEFIKECNEYLDLKIKWWLKDDDVFKLIELLRNFRS